MHLQRDDKLNLYMAIFRNSIKEKKRNYFSLQILHTDKCYISGLFYYF